MINDLRNAKVGDKVILSSRFNDNKIVTIEKITPKGFLKVGNSLFYPDGRERATGWYTAHIQPATQEQIEKIERKQFVRVVLKKLHELKDITYEQAVLFADILKEQQNESNIISR
jgi:hypothetical protein